MVNGRTAQAMRTIANAAPPARVSRRGRGTARNAVNHHLSRYEIVCHDENLKPSRIFCMFLVGTVQPFACRMSRGGGAA